MLEFVKWFICWVVFKIQFGRNDLTSRGSVSMSKLRVGSSTSGVTRATRSGRLQGEILLFDGRQS